MCVRSKKSKLKPLHEVCMDGHLCDGFSFAGLLLSAPLVMSLERCFLWWWDWGMGSEGCYRVEKGLTWKGSPSILLINDSWFLKPNFSIFWDSKSQNNQGGRVPVTIKISYICIMFCTLESSFACIILFDPLINPMRWFGRHYFLYFTAMESKKVLSVSLWSHSM